MSKTEDERIARRKKTVALISKTVTILRPVEEAMKKLPIKERAEVWDLIAAVAALSAEMAEESWERSN